MGVKLNLFLLKKFNSIASILVYNNADYQLIVKKICTVDGNNIILSKNGGLTVLQEKETSSVPLPHSSRLSRHRIPSRPDFAMFFCSASITQATSVGVRFCKQQVTRTTITVEIIILGKNIIITI